MNSVNVEPSERATDEDLRRLEDSLAESTAAIEAHDSERLHRANEDFHDAIIASAHNHLLASLHEPLMGRLHWLLRQNEEPLPLHAEHEHLYDAIMSRDPEKASVASQAHIRSSRLMARRTLGNAGDDSEPAASEAWHCAQLLRNSFWPMASAPGSRASPATSIFA